MTNARGISLIEILVYLFISSILLLSMHRLFLNLITFSMRHTHQQDDLLQIACGLNRLAQDLNELSSLKEYSSDMIVGSIKGRDYIWRVKNGRLLRGEGTWSITRRFVIHSQSLLASSLSSITFKYVIIQNRVVGVICTIKSCYHTLSQFILLRKLHE
jgi:hypothetical protein